MEAGIIFTEDACLFSLFQ